MITRRDLLVRALQSSSLFAIGTVVPRFIAGTAQAAEAGKDTVLIVVELTGGNDGLNTVIPYADDLYHKARPTLRHKKDQVIRVDDHIGLNPGLSGFQGLLSQGQLAIVQGVGYPNPDRSHFESMDIWQSADLKRRIGTGWIGRSVPELQDKKGNVPVMYIGPRGTPLAVQGGAGGVVSLNDPRSFHLSVPNADEKHRQKRTKLIEELAQASKPPEKDGLAAFVQRRELQTYTTLKQLHEVLNEKASNGQPQPANGRFFGLGQLQSKLQLISGLISKSLGTRVYYVALDGFDTHSNQAEHQQRLFTELSNAVNNLFANLKASGHDKRVLLMTFSEFGRRVQENGSRGTDHGAASCMFIAGPGVKGGPVGEHPSLSDLDSGDLKHHTDFRQVYATLLDQWLGCDSRIVLGEKFTHVDLLKAKA